MPRGDSLLILDDDKILPSSTGNLEHDPVASWVDMDKDRHRENSFELSDREGRNHLFHGADADVDLCANGGEGLRHLLNGRFTDLGGRKLLESRLCQVVGPEQPTTCWDRRSLRRHEAL